MCLLIDGKTVKTLIISAIGFVFKLAIYIYMASYVIEAVKLISSSII